MKSLRKDVFEYVSKKYSAKIEYLWKSTPNCAVFRHNDNKKWFGIVMDVQKNRFGIDDSEIIDVLNVRVTDRALRDFLLHLDGIFVGYHMNKEYWLSVFLDGSVSKKDVFNLIDISFDATSNNKSKKQATT